MATSWQRPRDLVGFHPAIAFYLTLRDLLQLRQAFGLKWTLETFPEVYWKRLVENSEWHGDLTLLPPRRRVLSWYRYMFAMSQRPQWKFRVDVIEHTLLGYNLVYSEDDLRIIHSVEFPCLMYSGFAPLNPTDDAWVILTSGDCIIDSNKPFFASYSTFTLKCTLIDDTHQGRCRSLAFCVSTFGGPNALILDEEMDWHAQARIKLRLDSDRNHLLVIVRRCRPSEYQIERVLARINI
jgi:hypothetical protein